MNKHFDCVDMKHKAGRVISKKLGKMTLQQQLDYWRNKHDELLLLKDNLLRRQKMKKKVNRVR